MNTPLLSICISTYNREESLKQLLQNITSQKGFSQKDIEVCIYNDPSNNPHDNTVAMVTDFQRKFNNIRFHRNNVREGMIPSILNVAQMGSGEYIWLFSDDDIMHPQSIATMLDMIRRESPGLILNKFLGFQGIVIPFDDKKAKEGPVMILHGMEELFRFFSTVDYSIDGYMMHCSLFCFRKDIFLKNLDFLIHEKGPEYMETLNKDYFGHVRIIYLPFGNTEKIIVLEKNLVLLRGGNISWSFVFKVCTDYRDFMNDLVRIYKTPIRTQLKMKSLYYYSVFTYLVIVHIQKYIPKKLYNFCVELGKRFVRIIKIG